jgi:outer membrane protein OmpA-like peptidoglycan-associated protein
MKRIGLFLAVSLVFCCTLPTLVQGQEQTTVKGLITNRTADALTLKTDYGSQTVTLTDSTKVQSPKGLGLRKEQMSWASLIPGLKVSVKGVSTGEGKFEAKTITFSKDDLETASMIQAGLTPTEEKVAANQVNIAANKEAISANEEEVNKRFSDLADYDVKDELAVYFASGKAAVSEKDKAALATLASNATKLSGYIIEVKGFADSTGNASMNQSLSKDRAYSVVNYLLQGCNVPPRRIVSPGAMGISNPVASNETTQGRSQNRRVEVKVLVNRGVAAGS